MKELYHKLEDVIQSLNDILAYGHEDNAAAADIDTEVGRLNEIREELGRYL